uniref:NADH-ubiquinone oxidoreductase chain 3 n=1 Tax=Herdmania momus TaxID=7733 RepID=D1GKY1_HERMO|nr:NADH dehydrogenase subunit 3 [Herdmania momus]CAX65568.1 NADH dehydrogenase subunit 3 [Herdmania momus]
MLYGGVVGGGYVMGLMLTFLVVFIGFREVLGMDFYKDLGFVCGYECGFEAFESDSEGYSIQFFVIGLSFMLFDLEICLLMPLVYSGWGYGGAYYMGYFFLMLVLMVFLYELESGAFGW